MPNLNSRTENTSPRKAAYLPLWATLICLAFSVFWIGFFFGSAYVRLDYLYSVAINLGDDVNTGPAAAPANEGASSVAGAAQATASAVPFGNTGTTTIPTDL